MATDNRKGRNVTEYHPTANPDGPKGQFRSYTSWGRTRQPKNLVGGVHGSEITPVTAADDGLATAGNPTALAAAAQPSAGFATESQRYLQLYYKNSEANAKKVTAWGYVHAFKKWFILQDNAAAAVTLTVNDGTVTKNGANAIDISGIDRLYFTTDTAFVANDEFYAAVNTISVK